MERIDLESGTVFKCDMGEVAQLLTKYRKYRPGSCGASSDDKEENKFRGGTMAEGYEYATRGGFKMKQRGNLSLEVPAVEKQTFSFNPYFDTSGNSVDIGAYLAGEPECMLNFEPVRTDRIIKLCVNLTAAYRVKLETLRKRGNLIVQLVRSLEDSGYRVEIDAVQASEDRDDCKEDHVVIQVKGAADAQHEDILEFMLGSPLAYRYVMWAIQDIGGGSCRKRGYHQKGSEYPQVGDGSDTRGRILKYDLDSYNAHLGTNYDLYIDGLSFNGKEDLEKIEKQIASFVASK